MKRTWEVIAGIAVAAAAAALGVLGVKRVASGGERVESRVSGEGSMDSQHDQQNQRQARHGGARPDESAGRAEVARPVVASSTVAGEEAADSPARPVPVEHRPANLRPGWNLPQPEHLPHPTYWPVVMALGITLLAWGVIASLAMSAVGLVLFAISLAGWLGDLHHAE